MAELFEERLGLSYGWNLGETEFKTGMDANIVKLGGLYGLSVISMNTLAPPVTPVNGTLFIVPPEATGAWLNQTNDVAYYVNNGWRFYTPVLGWGARVEDANNAIIWFDGTIWNTNFPVFEGASMVLGSATGYKFGTGPTQKMSFYGANPVAQQAGADQLEDVPTNVDEAVGALAISDVYDPLEVRALRDATETIADDLRLLRTLVHAIRTVLVTLGFMKGAA